MSALLTIGDVSRRSGVAASALRSISPEVEQSAAAAQGPAQSGRAALDFALGPNLAAYVNPPGVAPSTHHPSAAGTAAASAMSRTSTAWVRTRTRPPRGVYLAALLRRFAWICSTREASPSM